MREGSKDEGDSLANADTVTPVPPSLAETAVTDHGGRDSMATISRATQVGRYVIIDRIGSGGMGVVYRAYDPELDRRLAIKLLKVSGVDRGELRARLLREGQALAKVSHPNVVSIYDVGNAGEAVFIAMELVQGKTLRSWLAEDKPSLDAILDLFVAAGRGLVAAHRAGLIHRDFKPDNVLVDADNRPRVLDFGIARAASGGPIEAEPEPFAHLPRNASPIDTPLTRAGDRLGTPLYMAPEQHRGGSIDARADQFAFGVALWEALYRAMPFPAKSFGELAARLERGEPEAPPATANVPPWLHAVMLRALRVAPEDRFTSMEALLGELDAGIARARMRPLRRRRVLLGALAVSTTIGAVAMFRGHAAPPAALSCDTAPSELAGIWDTPTQDSLRTAFRGTRLGYADDCFGRFRLAVSSYAAAWSAARRDACVAARIRHEVPEDVYESRVACLDQRRAALRALVGTLRHPTTDDVKQAPSAPTALFSVDSCAHATAHTSIRPLDIITAVRERSFQARLADVFADYALGRTSDVLAHTEAIRSDAEKIGFSSPAVLGSVALFRGRAAADLGRSEISIPSFAEAFSYAVRADDTRVMGDASVRLAQEYLYVPRLDDFAAWVRIGRSAAARDGSVGDALFLDQLECMAYYWSGKERTRLTCMRALADRATKTGKLNEWQLTMLGIAASEAGEPIEALTYSRASVAYATEILGPTHPRTLEMRAYLAHGYSEAADHAAAERETADAMKILLQVAPEETHVLAELALYRGLALYQLGRVDESRPFLETASKDPDTKEYASGPWNRVQAGRDPKKRLALAQKALDDDLKQFPDGYRNIINSRLEVCEACLELHDAACAQKALAPLDGKTAEDEVDAYILAELEKQRGNIVVLAHGPKEDALKHYRRAAEIARSAAAHNPKLTTLGVELDALIAKSVRL